MADRPLKLKGGRLLDQDLIDKITAEAERGYDLSKARRVFLRSGRPAKGEPPGESPRVASRVPEPVYEAALHRARAEGLTMSQLIRALLVAYGSGRGPVARTDSDPTAMAQNKGERRRTVSPSSGRSSELKRTSVNSRKRTTKGL